MFVTETLVGTVAAAPELRYTTRSVPVASFALSTDPAGDPRTATTWSVAAYASLALEVMETLEVGDPVIVTGIFASSGDFTSADGVTRTRIECRAQSVAPALGAPVAPARFALRGTVATIPDLITDGPEPLVELEVRTSRFKRGDTDYEVDVTYWPVAAAGETAERIADWQVGDSVVVVGEARPLFDPPEFTPQVEIMATTAGVDLHPQEEHPDAKLSRPGRASRGKSGGR